MRNNFFDEFEDTFNGTESFGDMFDNAEQRSDDVIKTAMKIIATVGITTMGYVFYILKSFRQ